MDRYTSDNMANWDDRVPIHAASDLYGIDSLISDPKHLSSIVTFDQAYLGKCRGRRFFLK